MNVLEIVKKRFYVFFFQVFDILLLYHSNLLLTFGEQYMNISTTINFAVVTFLAIAHQFET